RTRRQPAAVEARPDGARDGGGEPRRRGGARSDGGRAAPRGRRGERSPRGGGGVSGVVARDREGAEPVIEAPLTIGADGRDSRIAELSGVKVKTYPHGRFADGGYFDGTAPKHAPDAAIWMMNPDWAASFPTDDGLVFYAAMPTMKRLPDFKEDPEAALIDYFEAVPDAPSLHSAKLSDRGVFGKIDMTNRMRVPTAPGLALIGDAALATDPLFGVGCGWAFQSAQWLGGEGVAGAAGAQEA